VADCFNRAAVDDVAHQAVPVAGHGDKVAVFTLGGPADFRGRVAQRQLRGDGQAVGAELGGGLFEA
jgi:hypothetical protein